MARALRLAARGLYTTMPNPRVGCVIVKDGRVVGEGWHERAGEPHAEIHALRAAGAAARGATVYVSLEPCSHHGRTPPCANALIDAGVARVVAAMRDPNPQVAGNGIELLTLAGVRAEVGLLAAEAHELNPGFVSRMTRGRPWLRLKTASSLDGKTALNNGQSQWITGAAARADVQRWRARSCAILTGVGTVAADDPQMTVRDFDIGRQPLKVILDSQLRTPPTARILAGGALVVAALDLKERRAALSAAGAEVLVLPGADGHVDLPALLVELGRRGINEVHVEAGAVLNGAFLAAGLVDEWLAYVAPKVMGDAARGLFGLPELSEMAGCRDFRLHDLAQVGGDLRLLLRPL
ncbi:diaminohydroxyphosphoribosylaminopyrimidine deaminase/5-amino-6-(5-phosphoribosylamino)uracil reductase [Sulfuritortus calidifontis]|uniref:Riboflavin biosynthesis protein RibD n=2 Tax=Sulfuritortus calidifontis TaxID=1914471 RepID=A0A4R3JW46_9PROT|nr:bifunctional diaminohydroxyphosphoribosylaminopyrimidine deaminase/5-amino-6-(5-phosphoribosylamino)uracil reductase RibD [Sulfuritortus calidifontis]TCS72359.1 diaminohydroxyphosphoribosylaminopyrimidine deaminase/5-amino-6-(5-phosphoribosylamino)uracil reductase [Sulfuritortus calidifontis]